jgi:hypothetical protein
MQDYGGGTRQGSRRRGRWRPFVPICWDRRGYLWLCTAKKQGTSFKGLSASGSFVVRPLWCPARLISKRLVLQEKSDGFRIVSGTQRANRGQTDPNRLRCRYSWLIGLFTKSTPSPFTIALRSIYPGAYVSAKPTC